MAQLPDDLLVIDALLNRWGRGISVAATGLSQLEQIRIFGIIVGPCTDNSQWMDIVDREVTHAPAEIRVVLIEWYKNRVPSDVKAKALGLSRAALYAHWRASLRYMQGALRGRLSSAI
jgi:hypothetical protein